jgi:hypothetical protein
MRRTQGFVQFYGIATPAIAALVMVVAGSIHIASAKPYTGPLVAGLLGLVFAGLSCLANNTIMRKSFEAYPKEWHVGTIVTWTLFTSGIAALVPALAVAYHYSRYDTIPVSFFCAGVLLALAAMIENFLVEGDQPYWRLQKLLVPLGVGCYFGYIAVGNKAYGGVGFFAIMAAYVIASILVWNNNRPLPSMRVFKSKPG